ncbi:peptidyl-prolyl cis-trans isomerase FKBP16-3, chloroplastic isoform X2 [Primulina huaijiensis]|uniref:peptidyl-prolyl cis-trans isomerase FKBP16-3, chloroplastic isoform X2 n=1 Tax=Primulina huaijiensis TaxID=1492673 RepID=UPI003CC71319
MKFGVENIFTQTREMASASLLLPLGPTLAKKLSTNHRRVPKIQIEGSRRQSSVTEGLKALENQDDCPFIKRRILISISGFGLLNLVAGLSFAEAAGLPPEEKPKLCDDTCEKELENVPMVTTESGLQYKDIKVGGGPSPPVGFQVAANYVAMVPSGQVFDSSLEKGQFYIFRVGSGQVIKGLDEGILTMKAGGKRRLYIPGPLAFPKGLASAPGRPRVAANSPVVFDVSLEYIPGLEDDE